MAYKVLYRKYRPDDFDNLVGQDYTIRMLRNAISSDKHAHAYIFTGPRGTGKTSSAKLFAKALNCENPVDGNPCNKCSHCLNFKENPDIIEIDAASNNGVDEIRELVNSVSLVPSESRYKVYIIDEVHMLSTSAFNALLLTLEEPPEHVVFILATTDIQNVPITILSRCQRFDFKPISLGDMAKRIRFICDNEKIEISDDAINEIGILAAGGMRDALGMLDQLSVSGKKIEVEDVSNYFGSISYEKIDGLIDALGNKNVSVLLEILGNIKDSGTHYSVFIEKLVLRLRESAISLKKDEGSCKLSFSDIYSLIFDLNNCLCNINISVDPYVLLEMVLLKYCGSSSSNVINSANDSLGNNSVDKHVKSSENKVKDSGKKIKVEKKEISFVLDVRVNNCFYGASKAFKAKIGDSWIGFMNYLMAHDRNLLSLLTDSEVLAASDKYALIHSKNEDTNDLINFDICKLESYFEDFFGSSYHFAALNSEKWKNVSEICRNNLKNKIKYNYIEENVADKVEEKKSISDSDDLVDLGNNIFGDALEVE